MHQTVLIGPLAQTLRIGVALVVASPSTNLLPVVTVYAAKPGKYDYQVSQMVASQVLASTSIALPEMLPATGASDSSNIYLILGMAFSAFTYFAMMRRYEEA